MFTKLIAIVALLAVSVTPAYAEDREWVSDPPKQGVAGFHLCIGEAEAGGHSYRNVNYIDSTIVGNCDRYAREDVARYFRFRHGLEIDPASVRVTVQRP